MAVINPIKPPAFFRSIGRRLRIWMNASAAQPGSRPAADGVTEAWHLAIVENKVRTLAGRWPNSATTLSGRLAGFGFDEETSMRR
jgi:hypothetical protein